MKLLLHADMAGSRWEHNAAQGRLSTGKGSLFTKQKIIRTDRTAGKGMKYDAWSSEGTDTEEHQTNWTEQKKKQTKKTTQQEQSEWGRCAPGECDYTD